MILPALPYWRWILVACTSLIRPYNVARWAWWVFMYALRLFQPSGPAATTTAPAHDPSSPTPAADISGLAPGVTACGAFLLTKAAALASSASAAPSVATISSIAFPSGPDLKTIVAFPPEWEENARALSKKTDAAIGRFQHELQREWQGLAYGRHLAQDTVRWVDRLEAAGREESMPHGFVAALWGSELGRRKKLCQRALNHLLHLNERSVPAVNASSQEFVALNERLATILRPAHGDGLDPSRRDEPASVYRTGISKLNAQFNAAPTQATQHPTARGLADGRNMNRQDNVKQKPTEQRLAEEQFVQSLLVSASSEQAAFLQDLHTAQGAGTMVYGVVYHAKERLTELQKVVSNHWEWMREGETMGEKLDIIRGRLDVAESSAELGHIAKEMVDLADEWRGEIQKIYHV